MRWSSARPASREWSTVGRAQQVVAIVAAVSLWSAPAASAHSLLVSRGEAAITSDEVRVTISVFAEDFLHFGTLRVDADGSLALAELTAAAERHAGALAGELAVIDGRGTRLDCIAATARPGWSATGRATIEELRQLRVRYELTFRLPAPTPVLTFRVAQPEQRMSVQSQCVLRAFCAGSDVHRTLRLTSRGNSEGVELAWIEGTPRVVAPTPATGDVDPAAPFDPHGSLRFNDVCLDVALDNETVRATAYIPLPLWESFEPTNRADENRLTASEADAIRRSAEQRLRGALTIGEDAGRADWPFTVTVDSLHDPAFDGAKATDATDAVSFWAARLIVRYEPRTDQEGQGPNLSWNLFNGLVMSAEAVVRSPRGARMLGLSPFERVITLR